MADRKQKSSDLSEKSELDITSFRGKGTQLELTFVKPDPAQRKIHYGVPPHRRGVPEGIDRKLELLEIIINS